MAPRAFGETEISLSQIIDFETATGGPAQIYKEYLQNGLRHLGYKELNILLSNAGGTMEPLELEGIVDKYWNLKFGNKRATDFVPIGANEILVFEDRQTRLIDEGDSLRFKTTFKTVAQFELLSADQKLPGVPSYKEWALKQAGFFDEDDLFRLNVTRSNEGYLTVRMTKDGVGFPIAIWGGDLRLGDKSVKLTQLNGIPSPSGNFIADYKPDRVHIATIDGQAITDTRREDMYGTGRFLVYQARSFKGIVSGRTYRWVIPGLDLRSNPDKLVLHEFSNKLTGDKTSGSVAIKEIPLPDFEFVIGTVEGITEIDEGIKELLNAPRSVINSRTLKK